MRWFNKLGLAIAIPSWLVLGGCETHHEHVIVEHRAEPDAVVAGYGGPVIVDAPPPVVHEVVPAAPEVDMIWIDGYYRHDGRHYVWVGGHYERPPHRDAHWTSGRWDHVHNGYVWHEGHWD